MTNEINDPPADFTHAWVALGLMGFMQLIYILLAHFMQEGVQQAAIDEGEREIIRGVFYVLAIVMFPMTNLIRHIKLRLNETMPSDKSLNQRYLLTVIVSQGLIASVGVFGFVMFMLGDGFNTLYIFSTLAFLGLFLHRPKYDEYQSLTIEPHD
ncbi:MAG: hypothetical protein GQ569_01400 [Methylococcaceae bacterium]|nr:hypothetical protein [Methylococcaceae bacterium]